MSRNELCACGSGKKFKKCCGAPAKLALAAKQASLSAPANESPTPEGTAEAAPDQLPGGLFKSNERAVSGEKAEEERKKHLRRRSESKELRGTLVYNSGSAFRRRTP